MKKKVIFVVHQLNYGGVQKALLSALDALDYERNEVTLYVRKARTELLPYTNKNVSRIIVNDDKNNYYRRPYAVWLWFVIKLLGVFGCDASAYNAKLKDYVIACGEGYEKEHYFPDSVRYDTAVAYIQGYTARFVAENVPADRKVMFWHGSEDEHHGLHESCIPSFGNVYAVNPACRDILRRFYPAFAEKIGFIENYVDPLPVLEKSLEKTEIEKRALTLCTCGRIAPVKGFDTAVGAASVLKKNGLDFIWYFVGDGPERAGIEKLIRENGLDENIVVTGMLDNPYPYIAACDVFVQTSRAEAHPLTIVEAQILRRPVVTTPTAGGKYLVKSGDNGIVCGFDAESAAAAVMKIASDDDFAGRMSVTDCAAKKREYENALAEAVD